MSKCGTFCLWTLLGLMTFDLRAQETTPPETPAKSEAAPAVEASEAATEPAAATPEAGATEAAPQFSPEVIAVQPVRETPEASTTVPEGTQKLDDVVVTVTKRAQNSRDIPSSMAVLGGEKLEQLGVRELKEIFTLVPGVNMQDEMAGLQRKTSVRGVGPDDNTNQTVGSVMGDTPISDPYGSATIIDPNPWDMRTVEVLKGPQGTLFGATSLAGLIRYVPNNPELELFSGKAFVDYTSIEMGDSAVSYGGALNIPIGSTIALRTSGILQNAPGIIDSDNPSRQQEDINSRRNWSGRVMALWQPTDRLTVNLWHNRDRRHADEINIVTNRDGTYTRDDAPAPSPSDSGFDLSTLDVRYAFDWATLVSISGYQEKTNHTLVETSYLIQPLAQAGISFARTDSKVKTHGVLQELRLVSPDDGSDLSWLAGAYYSTYSADILGQLYIAGTEFLSQLGDLIPLPLLDSLITEYGLTATQNGFSPLEADERALFGEATYKLTDTLNITLGGRFYRTTVSGTKRSSGVSGTSNGQTPGTTEEGWSPKLAFTWTPWNDVLLYGTVSRGFQFGGFNLPTVPNPQIPESFKSSTLWNYEAGVRTDWFDNTLRFDLTAFYLDWTNPQVSQADNTALNRFVDNVGASRSIGVETTLRWITPLDGLTLEQSTSYIDARTTEPFTDASGVEVPEGALMPSSPLLQSVTTLSYTRPIGSWMTQALLINSLQDESWAEITHVTEVGGFSLLNLNFSVAPTHWSWKPALTLAVNNITNVQEVAAGFSPASPLTGGVASIIANSGYVYNPPRSFVVRLSAEF